MTVTIKELIAIDCGGAVSVGPGGDLRIGNLSTRNTPIGINAYGGGSVQVDNYRLEGVQVAVNSDDKSKVSLGSRSQDSQNSAGKSGLRKYVRGWVPSND